MYETINSPINYGGLELKNRIIFAPTTFGLAEDEYFEKIRKIAAGGCAMVIIGDVPVGKSQFEKSLFDKKGFAHYQKLVEIVHSYDCRICAQLHQSDSNMLAMLKYVPGVLTKKISMEELRPLLNAEVAPYISKLSTRKIHKIINGFGEAAVLAVKAGFDMVQVHGDRMCGSFSSTVFNHRTDEYGGSAENRARFAVEAVKAIRSRLPEIPIDYKLAVRQEDPHYGNAGVVESELGIFVPLLTDAGVTSFHVTLANHSSLEDTIPPANHPYFKEQGCFLKFCDEVRQYTDKPITGVGGLNQPDFVEQQLASGRITCAAMSRQLLADPDWVNKLKDGISNNDEIIVTTHVSKYVPKDSFIPDGMSAFARNVKRIGDFILSLIALVVFSPLFLICYIAIRREDGGSAIFKQERIGRFGRPFYIYKFRSMCLDAEKFGPQLSHSGGDNDPRLTKTGRFIRAHHLDELPQLYNVLRGDMAFIGPRPERKFYIDQILEHDARYTYLYQIRPGVTSYATLYNGYTDTMEKMLRRLEYDLYYLGHRSWLFDFKILLNTFRSIVFGKKF